jgi:dihydroflavonol-4-reductase
MEAGVRCVEAALDDRDALARAAHGCEVLFHVAGAVGFGDEWELFRRVNVDGTRNVLAAARLAGVRRVVQTSSIVAIGAAESPRLLDETAAWNLGKLRVPYVTSKRLAEEEALAAAGRALEVVVVNPASVVGPDDFSGSEFGTLCRRFWRGRIPFHFGGGNNYVDVRDVTDGHLRAAAFGRCGERYLLGGNNRTYTGFFADLARAARRPIFRLRLPVALARLGAALHDRLQRHSAARTYLSAAQARLLPLFFYYDSSKAERELGYRPRSLGVTLNDTHRFWMGWRMGAQDSLGAAG